VQIDDYAIAPAAVRIASAHAGTLVIHLSSPRRDSVMRSDNRAPHETSARANITVEEDFAFGKEPPQSRMIWTVCASRSRHHQPAPSRQGDCGLNSPVALRN
jgi:hypothetical protein